MHANAGVVTALQQAVAHLSSALETLTNRGIKMLMSCAHAVPQMYGLPRYTNIIARRMRDATASTHKGFFFFLSCHELIEA